MEALESRLAKRKFDSDEDSSESEAEPQSELDGAEDAEVVVDAAAGGDKKDD